MDVVSINDGKNLGKVCDLAFFFPENKIKGFFVTGSRGFKFSKSDIFVPISEVTKIGEDVILVKLGSSQKPKPDCPPPPPPQRPCPPPPRPCPPPCPPPPHSQNGRRNYDDYE